jgi:hypothetical protein
MTKSKRLKMPDGGTFEINMPQEFGDAPVLALNDAAGNAHRNPYVVYGVGIALGVVLAYLFLHTGAEA